VVIFASAQAHWRLTFVGADRERQVAAARVSETVCTRAADLAVLGGRSTWTLGAMKHLLAAIALVPLLTGCDPGFGIVRSADDVSVIPPDSCVVGALGAIPGIGNVSVRTEDGSRPLTLHGIEKPDKLHYYYYQYQGIPGWLYFSVSYSGRVSYRQGKIWLGNRTPQRQEVINRLYPAFNLVERALETKCGMADLIPKVHEQCIAFGFRCRA